jgi:hypothetical protein
MLFPETTTTDRLGLELVGVHVEGGNDKSGLAVETYVEAYSGEHDGFVRNATVRPDGLIIDHHRYVVKEAQYRDAASDT